VYRAGDCADHRRYRVSVELVEIAILEEAVMDVKARVMHGIKWRLAFLLIFVVAFLLALDVSGGDIGTLIECVFIFFAGMLAMAYPLDKQQQRVAQMEHDLITTEGLYAFDAPDGVWRGEAFRLKHPSLRERQTSDD
jgi:hypothetical protein